MVLPLDKSAKSFNVSVVRLNQKYAPDYNNLTTQSMESEQKLLALQRYMIYLPGIASTHKRVTEKINYDYQAWHV